MQQPELVMIFLAVLEAPLRIAKSLELRMDDWSHELRSKEVLCCVHVASDTMHYLARVIVKGATLRKSYGSLQQHDVVHKEATLCRLVVAWISHTSTLLLTLSK